MTLKSIIIGIMHDHAEPDITFRPWFQVLNSYQGHSAHPGFATSIS